MATKRVVKASAPKVGRANTKEKSVRTVDREIIARRAYELFLARGMQNGNDLEDWLAAERELVGS